MANTSNELPEPLMWVVVGILTALVILVLALAEPVPSYPGELDGMASEAPWGF